MTRFSTFHAYFRGSTFGGITSPTEKFGGPKPSVGWLDNATVEPKKSLQTIKPKTSREQFKTTSLAGKTNATEPTADSQMLTRTNTARASTNEVMRGSRMSSFYGKKLKGIGLLSVDRKHF